MSKSSSVQKNVPSKKSAVKAEVKKPIVSETGQPNLSAVVDAAAAMSRSLEEIISSLQTTLYQELRGISSYIETTRHEIGHLQPNDLSKAHIPLAGKELDEVLGATEEASNNIMTAAEDVLSADASDPEAYKALVDDKMMQIIEACAFQDITGQRVRKVVETLQTIETRIARFADAVKIHDADFDEVASDREKERRKRAAELILHGPALSGDGHDQDSVDALFSTQQHQSNDQTAQFGAVSQDDIDGLFR